MRTLHEDVEAMCAWRVDRVVREFHAGAIEEGRIVAPSGREFIAVPEKRRYLLHSVDEPGTSLLTTFLDGGFAIEYAFDQGRVWRYAAGRDPVLLDDIPGRALMDHFAVGNEGSLPYRSRPLSLLCGDENFAHFIWNQLPALIACEDSLARAVESGTLELVLPPLCAEAVDGVGGWDSLLPNLSGRTVPRPHRHDGAFVPLASTTVSNAARSRVQSALGPTRRLQGPVLWVSLKPPPRSPGNQVAFAALLARRWLQSTDGTVILDGATGTSSDYLYDRAPFPESDDLIESVLRAVGSMEYGRVMDTRGLLLHEALALACEADFYVSPEGTIQHKVAWVWNVPGVVHVGARPYRDAVVAWHADQVEDAAAPLELPARYVIAAPESPDSLVRDPDRDVFYEIAELDGAVEWIVRAALSALHVRRGPAGDAETDDTTWRAPWPV